MKKISIILSTTLIVMALFWLGFNYNRVQSPKEYYQVYLDDEVLGVINSKKKLEKYIDNQGDYIKKKYNVSNIYAPNGLEIKKIVSYDGKVSSIESIYNKIKDTKPFTLSGYQFTVKNDKINNQIYVLDKNVFKEAINQTIETFVGKDEYGKYVDKTQKKIETTGTTINDVYLEDNITIKETNISYGEKIYTDPNDLTKFLIFGTTDNQKTYKVLLGDTIETVAFNNKISVAEFLISNPTFTSESNLLFPGQEVVIGITDPQVQVTVLEYSVKDVVSKYKTEEKYDPDSLIGTEKILQDGEDGLDRVSQTSKIVNGTIVGAVTTPMEELKPSINKIVLIGQKFIPSVGTLTNWYWPSQDGWVITSTYGYRINPFDYTREFHGALDIAGPGMNSKIYAANNGVVVEAGLHYSYGNYIIINHNNGYYTLYAHMSRLGVVKDQVVAKGSVIGYMGMSGSATGVHLHFEAWKGYPWQGGTRMNPWGLY